MHREEDCLRCGRCCRLRIRKCGEVFVLPWSICPHQDVETKLCKIYEHRFERTDGVCLTVEQGIQDRAYPADCPYVKGMTGYRPPIEVPSMEAMYKYLSWW